MGVAEGKIKADGTTLGHRAKNIVVCTLVERRRAAPSKTLRSAALLRNVNVRAAFHGTMENFVVFLN